MTTAFRYFIKINALGFQNPTYTDRIECKISKTNNPYDITEMNIGNIRARVMQEQCQFTG